MDDIEKQRGTFERFCVELTPTYVKRESLGVILGVPELRAKLLESGFEEKDLDMAYKTRSLRSLSRLRLEDTQAHFAAVCRVYDNLIINRRELLPLFIGIHPQMDEDIQKVLKDE